MRRPSLLLAAVLSTTAVAAAAAGAATGAGDGDGTDARAAQAQTVVRFSLSGGFVGRDVRLSLRSDRRAIVTDRRAGTKRHTIKSATLKALRRTLDAAHVEQRLSSGPSGCADCFNYAITYKGHRAAFDDSTIPSRMRKAVAELRRITDGGR